MPDYDFHIHSPRLIITHFNGSLDSHCDFLIELFNAPETLATNGGIRNEVLDRKAARENIEDNQETVDSKGWGRYLILLKPNGKEEDSSTPFSQRVESYPKIGTVSMKVRRDGGPIPDVGYSLLPCYWRQGYATEAASALVKYFIEEKGWTEFMGYCHPDNENSKRVLQRLGFEKRGIMKVKGIAPNGVIIEPLVWSKGLKRSLEDCDL